MWSLLGLALIPFLMVNIKKWRKQWLLRKWRSSLNLDAHEKVFNQLYQSVSGFHLSKQARADNDSPEYVYGEIEFQSLIALLSLCDPGPQTCFYDLGSGTGKAVIASAMVFPVKKSCGIELFESLHNCALQQQRKLEQTPAYNKQIASIHFENKDIFTADFSDATLVYINATAFFGERWERLSHLLESIAAQSLVLSTSKPLQSPLFTLLRTVKVQMNWGEVSVFIQQKQAASM
ncbi:Histone methylation protein DOT1 [Legionella birminghamensis]|uniref:Histone-lysine N-methyltransferase, H3 lysine-79 specific n=1 Tax=Legionella birminghamensis TaxID=28083 RepID=A0A378I729_9GAMM|nr:hypothetical protein [Legionella birminghamensis]KTC73905.1 Histone methylation protein DOT1 [Legionella birminghamensis]STX30451.1 putative methyltransferases [Legionella birminghamensis]